MSSIDLLKSMVRIPSVNPFRIFLRSDVIFEGSQDELPSVVGLGAEENMNVFVEDRLREYGFQTERQLIHPACNLVVNGQRISIPARWNVLGTRPPETGFDGTSLLLFGHTDTVDVKHGWETDPFTATAKQVDGRDLLFGLGVNDMKGGLAAILDAVARSRTNRSAIKVAFLADEEYYSLGADLFSRSSFLDDVIVALAPEIGDSHAYDPSESAPPQWIGLGRLGRVEFEFSVLGTAAHGADVFVRTDWVNAVHECARLESHIADDCAQSKREYSSHGVSALNSAYISYHFGGEATLSIPDRAGFTLDRTLLPDETAAGELQRLQSLVNQLQERSVIDPRAKISVKLKLRPTPACEPYFFSPDNPHVAKVIAVTREFTKSVQFGIGRSVADENRVAMRGVPTLTLGPFGAGSHTNHEWVDVVSVTRTAEIYREVISQF